MSLVRLLTAGKSLVGLTDSTARYRMTNPGALPKFGSAKNPFRATTNPEAARTGGRGLHEPVAGTAGMAPSLRVSPPVEEGEKSPVLGEMLTGEQVETEATPAPSGSEGVVGRGEVREATSPPVGAPKRAGWFSRWAAKLKTRFSRVPGKLAKPSKSAKPAIPRFEKPPVQGELSLDSIKVVRNDLSDADLEVVPVKPPPAGACGTPAVPGAGKAGSAETRWGQATRLLGAGKS